MPNRYDWDLHLRSLLKATCGAITSSMRCIVLRHEYDKWLVTFYLENDDLESTSDVEEIMFDYEQFYTNTLTDWEKFFQYNFSDHAKHLVNSEIIFSDDSISCVERGNAITVFKRKEVKSEGI